MSHVDKQTYYVNKYDKQFILIGKLIFASPLAFVCFIVKVDMFLELGTTILANKLTAI